jgi:hypothetical protein
MSNIKQIKSSNANIKPRKVQPVRKLCFIKKQKTLTQLVAYINLIKNRNDMTRVEKYWIIGKSILKYYEGRGRVQIFSKLTKETGLGETHLILIKHFAKVYSRQQMQELLNGPFIIQWSHIAKYLFINSQIVVDKYKTSLTENDFCNALTNVQNRNYSISVYRKIITDKGNKPNLLISNGLSVY